MEEELIKVFRKIKDVSNELNNELKNLSENETLLSRYQRNEQERKTLEKEIQELDEEERKQFWCGYHGISSNIDKLFQLNEEMLAEILGEIQILRKEVKSINSTNSTKSTK